MHLVDFDGDGDSDLLAGNGDEIDVYFNPISESLPWLHTNVVESSDLQEDVDLFLADLDGDTVLEIVAHDPQNDLLTWYETELLPARADVRPGTLGNPSGYQPTTLPILGTEWRTHVALKPGNVASSLTIGFGGPVQGIALSSGEVLCLPPYEIQVSFDGQHSLAIPGDCALLGAIVADRGVDRIVLPDEHHVAQADPGDAAKPGEARFATRLPVVEQQLERRALEHGQGDAVVGQSGVEAIKH